MPRLSTSQGHARASESGLGLCCSARARCMLRICGGTISPRNSPRVRLGGPLGGCCVVRCVPLLFANRRTLRSGHLVLTGMLAQVERGLEDCEVVPFARPHACALLSVLAPSRPQGHAYVSGRGLGECAGWWRNSEAPVRPLAWDFGPECGWTMSAPGVCRGCPAQRCVAPGGSL